MELKVNASFDYDIICIYQGPVDQSIDTLKTSLSCQLVKYICPLYYQIRCYFLLEESEVLTIFSAKNHIIFAIFMFEILTKS